MATISNTLETLFAKMENYVSTKTVIGEAITVGNVTLLPLVDVTFGVGAGGAGGANDDSSSSGENGGGGLGAKLAPTAVVVVMEDSVQLINIKNQDSVNKLIDLVPGIAAKLTEVFDGIKKDKKNKDVVLEKETL